MLRDLIRTARKRMYRLPMRLALRTVAKWHPVPTPASGYTVVIGCMARMSPLAVANLNMIARMNTSRMRELVLVLDCREPDVPENILRAVALWKKPAVVRVMCYKGWQERVARSLDWGWVYAWLSWCIGVGCARTRHVLLHDLDALPLDPELFETLYTRAAESGARFHGIRHYVGHGIDSSMKLATTFELVIDAEYLRNTFAPLDCFNQVALINGKYVDFDTFLHVQYLTQRTNVDNIKEQQLIHPSQMICQYTDLVAGRGSMNRRHNLLMLPYYYYLGGCEDWMRSVASSLSVALPDGIEFVGKALPVGQLSPAHWAWMSKQIACVEMSVYGVIRPEVAQYVAALGVQEKLAHAARESVDGQ